MKKKEFLVSLALSLIFFLVSILTISDYNVNWDEPVHFMRGQAYLRYLITREKDYNKLPYFGEFRRWIQNRNQKPEIVLPRYSLYQTDVLDASYFLENDGGHPPLNGILASMVNQIFYQKLGIIGDIESYHLFVVFASSVLVFLIFYWAYKQYGFLAGLVSFLSLSLYPLFFGESHNNVKDPVETCFFALTIYGFYKGITEKNWKWIIFSSLFCGLALGTKFNILFVPFIIFPWLVARYFKDIFKFKQKLFIKVLKLPRKILLSLIFYPFIVFTIFFATWPYLWSDPFARILSVFGFYKQMGGSGVKSQPPSFYIHGFNTYPIQTIIFTTPLVILFFAIIGILACVFLFKKEKGKISFLWLLWFLIPIFRVSAPGASIYGGLRQIMEYIPAMALLTGVGANSMVTWLHGYIAKIKKPFNHLAIQLSILLMFLPIAYKMIQLHPNQNLYFNPLIGGLKGAVARDFPGWGVTLGNPYTQGVKWVNKNAEPNAVMTLALGLMTNVPVTKVREDIEYSNALKSVILREGEYIIGLNYEGQLQFYEQQYPERYLNPVYEKQISGVSILKVWKNDLQHTKKGFVEEKDISSEIKMTIDKNGLFVDLLKEYFLTKVELQLPGECLKEIKSGAIQTSINGLDWRPEPEGLLELQVPKVKKINGNKITHLFAALPARYLKITMSPFWEKCLNFDNDDIKITTLRDLKP